MPDDIITPIPDYIKQSLERAKKGIKLQPAGTMAPPPQPQMASTPQGFWESFKAANPVTGVISGLQEFYHRPQAMLDAQHALAAGMRIRAGKGLPGDQALVDKGMQANIGAPGQTPIMPMGSEPAALAGMQAEHGDWGGAGGTLGGGIVAPIVAGEVIPRIPAAARGAVKGAREAANAPAVPVPIRIGIGRRLGVELGVTPPKRIYTTAMTGAKWGGGAGGAIGTVASPGYHGTAVGTVIGAPIGAAIGAGKVLAGGAIRGAMKELAAAHAARAAAAEVPAVALPASRQITTGTIRMPAGEDTSYVRGVPGEYAQHEGPTPIPESRQLGAGPTLRHMGPGEDTSYVRGVPGEYATTEPGWTPPAGSKAAAAGKTPGQVFAESEGQSWADLSNTDRQLMEDIARARANVGDQPPPPPPKPPATPPPPPAEKTPPAESKSFAQDMEERMREHLRDTEKETPPPPPPPNDLEQQLEASIAAANAKKAAAKGDTPPPPPPAKPDESETGGKFYSKTKSPAQEVTSQIHAHLNAKFGRRVSITPAVEEIYGIKGKESWDRLHIDDKSAMNEFAYRKGRLPTLEDVENGAFQPPRRPFNYASGGTVDIDSPSRRIAEELRNQGLTSAQAISITPEQWGDLSRAAGVSAVGQYSVEDTLRHMKKLEGGLQHGGPVKPSPYITALKPAEEAQFQAWVKQNKIPFDPGPKADYDMRGFWKSMLAGQAARNPETKHFPDTYKTPYHQSFSNESIYATPDAPRWEGTFLVNKDGKVVFDDTLGGPPPARPFVGPLRKASGGSTRGFGLTPSQEDINMMLGTPVPITDTSEDTSTPFMPTLEDEPHRRVPKVNKPLPPPFRGPKPSITQEVLSTFEGVPKEVAGLEGTKGLVDPEGELDRVIRNYASIGKGIQGLTGAHTIGEGLGSLSDVGRGAFGLAGPLMPGWAAAAGVAPSAFFSGLTGGALSGHLAGKALEGTNLEPGTKAALEDVAGLAGGIGAAGIPGAWEAVRSMPPGTFSLPDINFGSERGSIPLGPGGLSDAAKVVKGAQKIVGGITDFNDWAKSMVSDLGDAVLPELQDLYQRSVLGADRATKDVKRRSMDDLDIRIPDEVRVVSPDPTKTITGQPFHSLDRNQPSEGFLPLRRLGPERANALLGQAWQEAINESEAGGGHTAEEAVRSTGARPPDAEFWDKSFSLPQGARYWYELSGESFTGKHVDIPREYQPALIDAVAGTSGGVEPGPNLLRGLGIFSENLQGLPVMTDLRDPASARKALDPDLRNQKTLKYGSFSGTMQRTAGLIDKNPLTTNDVQVGSMFGIKGTDIGKNPILYEVLSRFFLKLRDAQNAELGIAPKTLQMEPVATGEYSHAPAAVQLTAQPWETWQMQAPAWVYERIRKDPSKANEYDDYSQRFPDIIQKLQDAGVPTPGGKVTMDTLMDPRTPNLMSGTREQFIKSPYATVEVASNRTRQGKQAANTYAQLNQLDPSIPWVAKAKAGYEQKQRNTMRDLAMRKNVGTPNEEPSLISQLMSAVVGKPMEVSRLDWNGYGTFEGAISPNLRIPLTGRQGQYWRSLDKTEREAFLAMLGQDLNQDAMAAAHFKAVLPGEGNTYSVFLNRYDGLADTPAILDFSNKIGLPVSVTQHANGTVIDIHVFDGMPGPGPELQAISNAAKGTFGLDPNVKDLQVVARQRAGDYITRNGYAKAIKKHGKTQGTTGTETGYPSRVGEPGIAAGELSYLAQVRAKIQAIARQRDAEFATWEAAARQRLTKRTAKNPIEEKWRGGVISAPRLAMGGLAEAARIRHNTFHSLGYDKL